MKPAISSSSSALRRLDTIQVICRSGQRAYYATRTLLQHGFDAGNVSGGMLSRAHASFFLQEGPIEQPSK